MWTWVKGLSILVLAGRLAAAGELDQARKLYDHTDYQAALELLARSPEARSAAGQELAGKCAYQLGDFKKSIEFFEKAAALEPKSARLQHWLGRAWGRRAETANPFMAPSYASKTRQFFERAVQLDPANHEAVNDLFSYYLEAPGFLGGGMDKASALAEQIRRNDPAEYHFALAQLAERKKQWDLAEGQLRRAVELAPKQVGRLLDLAKFLARHGKVNESEHTLVQAAQVAPESKQVLFARASIYVETRRNLPEAKRLLEQYLQASLSPEDPPRDEARRLLRLASGS